MKLFFSIGHSELMPATENGPALPLALVFLIHVNEPLTDAD